MSDSTPADDEVESKLAGTTRRVYGCLLGSPSLQCGVRDIARKLKIKHPSVVLYHLQKLEELGLVDHTNTGAYYLVKEVRVGVLKLFFRLRGLLFPRLFFYSLFLSTLVVTYVILYTQRMLSLGTLDQGLGFVLAYVMSLVISFIACGVLWFETIMIWREKRF
jgi:hypothetical protein